MSISPRSARKFARAPFRLVAAAAAVLCLVAALAWPVGRAGAQTGGSPDVVISQVYTRGGESGAAYQNDFIELFNRGTATVDINRYSLQVTSTTGSNTTSTNVTFVSTRSINISPGHYLLIKLGSSGANGQALPVSEDLSATGINLGSTSGKIALVRNSDAIPAVACPVGQDEDIADFVGYGPSACGEGGSPAPAPTLTAAILRNGGGCTDTDNNSNDFTAATPNPRNSSSPENVCPLGSGAAVVQFAQTSVTVSETETHLDLTVNRTGDTASAVTVDYATTNGSATERQDYTTALGTLRFAANETSKTIRILLTDDGFPEGGNETFTVQLSNPSAGASVPAPIATVTITDNDQSTANPNPIDVPEFFVRQHYHDFLNREPDAAGLAFWTGQITECESRPVEQRQGCREVRRINVSAAFFLSPEFQETGYYALRVQAAAFGRHSNDPATRLPYRSFIRDSRTVGEGVVIGEAGAEARLEQNKQAYAEQVVSDPAFTSRYPLTMSATEYVNALFASAGVTPTAAEQQAAVNAYSTGGTTGRAAALRSVADSNSVRQKEFSPAFVLMEYYGYLRRNPTDSPDFTDVGYQFWLGKLNQFNGNYIAAEMVKAFITSPEYRSRFGL